MFQCGFYEMEITPPLGSTMPGYFAHRPADAVLDQLYVKAWVVQNDENRLALAAVDCIGLKRSDVEAIKARVARLCGIPADNVMVACSHTHTGGPTSEHEIVPRRDDGYLTFITGRVADCIALASRRVKPSAIRFGSGRLEGMSFCRIYRMRDGNLRTNPGLHNLDIVEPYKAIDKTVTVIEVRQEGQVAGIVVSFANHCDSVGSDVANSADYPGRLSRRLKERFGPRVPVLFLQGACGDINHVDFLHPGPTHERNRHIAIGDALAEEVVRVLAGGMEESHSEVLAAACRDITVPMRLPDAALLAWAEEIVARVPQDMDALRRVERDQVDLFFAMQALGAHQRQRTVCETCQQVMMIGELGIFASPSELFSAYGDELREKSPFGRTIVAGYANDYIGYIVTPECIRPGVYEARQTDGQTFAAQAGGMMNAQLLAMGREIAEKAGSR